MSWIAPRSKDEELDVRVCQSVDIEGSWSLLSPRSRPVGEKTESTAEAGVVQPGGGSCLAAAQADTAFY
jgi:hypothetical protein